MADWLGPATCANESTGCFCEQASGWLIQPANTLSALAFLVAAFFVVRARPANRYGWAYAAALAVVGVGTAYYHAKLTFLGQTIDVLGMNAVILAAIFHYFAQAFPGRGVIAARIGYAAAATLSFAGLIWASGLRRFVFAGIVLAATWLYLGDPRKLIAKEQRRWLLIGLGVFVLSFLIWNLEVSGAWCWPKAWLQPHAVWHIGGALAAYCLYRAGLRPSDSHTPRRP